MVTQQISLVLDRTCGTCTACCSVLPVRAAGFTKMPSTTCALCIPGRGCKIYDARPDACQTYYCVWRQSSVLDDEWRPDRSGVLITDEYEDVPEGYALASGVRFIVFGDHAAVRRPQFAHVIYHLVSTRTPVFLSIPGPPGCHAAKLFLNLALDAAVKANSLEQVSAILEQGIAKLKTFAFTPAAPQS